MATEEVEVLEAQEEVAAPEAEPQPSGVFIARVSEGGNLSFPVTPMGVDADQVQTIIEMGLKSWRSHLGL